MGLAVIVAQVWGIRAQKNGRRQRDFCSVWSFSSIQNSLDAAGRRRVPSNDWKVLLSLPKENLVFSGVSPSLSAELSVTSVDRAVLRVLSKQKLVEKCGFKDRHGRHTLSSAFGK